MQGQASLMGGVVEHWHCELLTATVLAMLIVYILTDPDLWIPARIRCTLFHSSTWIPMDCEHIQLYIESKSSVLVSLLQALECVPHRDLLSSPQVLSCPRPYSPLSTPVSRNLTARIARSNRPHVSFNFLNLYIIISTQNKRLFRAPSTVVNNKVSLFACLPSETLVVVCTCRLSPDLTPTASFFTRCM